MKITLENENGTYTIETKVNYETIEEANDIFTRLLLAAGYVFDPTYEQLELVDSRHANPTPEKDEEVPPFYGQTDHTEDGVDPVVEPPVPLSGTYMPCKEEGRQPLPYRGDSTPIPQV